MLDENNHEWHRREHERIDEARRRVDRMEREYRREIERIRRGDIKQWRKQRERKP